MTAWDVGRLLKIFWLHADDSSNQKPVHRVVFHALVLLFLHDDLRQGMVMGKRKFRDIKVALICYLVDRNRRQLVLTTEITRNELKEGTLEYKMEQ
ncbi:MAG: hypothetical protein Q9197_003199, partial [Variospora fuerteventurae]